jgi:NAD(P)-dependent dehydrogenase (short-subunit alcohol dehydrogenase family)
MSLKNKVAIVTGGGRGIAVSLVKSLAAAHRGLSRPERHQMKQPHPATGIAGNGNELDSLRLSLGFLFLLNAGCLAEIFDRWKATNRAGPNSRPW